MAMWPCPVNQSKYVTRRFLFDSSALVGLKAKAASSKVVPIPSRVEAVLGLIWKSAMAASNAVNGSPKPSVISLAVNLRRKTFPHLPKLSVGNLIWSAVAQWMPNTGAKLDCLVGNLREAISKINGGFVQEIQGKEGFLKVIERLKELGDVYSNKGANYYKCTSMCDGGLYEADFGWGKPIWVSLGGVEDPLVMNLIFLMDTRSGDGIEAWVILSEEEMAEFVRDPEFLAFASLDPSPLRLKLDESICSARM
ncbi:hypothetical protein Acr_23g0016990 [Actinidia rufa]|uniref:HXXXD-type acyl-transferase family protein n=1 Tax=Actinidia rufa TaxID=165716 RepID=A0A7J0GRQ5_9ERIC|nr:hypothetical protein Acr_23g0016990 [Actinidia rufa]